MLERERHSKLFLVSLQTARQFVFHAQDCLLSI